MQILFKGNSNLLDRNFVGIDNNIEFLTISQNRKEEIENANVREIFMNKIPDIMKICDNYS